MTLHDFLLAAKIVSPIFLLFAVDLLWPVDLTGFVNKKRHQAKQYNNLVREKLLKANPSKHNVQQRLEAASFFLKYIVQAPIRAVDSLRYSPDVIKAYQYLSFTESELHTMSDTERALVAKMKLWMAFISQNSAFINDTLNEFHFMTMQEKQQTAGDLSSASVMIADWNGASQYLQLANNTPLQSKDNASTSFHDWNSLVQSARELNPALLKMSREEAIQQDGKIQLSFLAKTLAIEDDKQVEYSQVEAMPSSEMVVVGSTIQGGQYEGLFNLKEGTMLMRVHPQEVQRDDFVTCLKSSIVALKSNKADPTSPRSWTGQSFDRTTCTDKKNKIVSEKSQIYRVSTEATYIKAVEKNV